MIISDINNINAYSNTLIFTLLLNLLKKPYSKPLECNVVYIPITISGHATSMTSK